MKNYKIHIITIAVFGFISLIIIGIVLQSPLAIILLGTLAFAGLYFVMYQGVSGFIDTSSIDEDMYKPETHTYTDPETGAKMTVGVKKGGGTTKGGI